MLNKTLLFLALATAYFYSFSQSIAERKVVLESGSGSFSMTGGTGHEADTITVFYHVPVQMTSSSKVLMVIPGAGRNADDYRDSWIQASEEHSILIISPKYPEDNYPYGDYHLGGVVKDLNLSKGITFKKNTNQVWIDEDVVEFGINGEMDEWIYHDFDRIFEIAKKKTGIKSRSYDMFGHSAGGQILHRFVLLNPHSKANRVLASNAGTYTLLDNQTDFPFGIKNIEINKKKLKKAFGRELTVFLGELDNADEAGGRMLRSTTADKQGTHRLARGTHFYHASMKRADELGFEFNWKLEIIPGVGHNQKEMASAAAKYLYGN